MMFTALSNSVVINVGVCQNMQKEKGSLKCHEIDIMLILKITYVPPTPSSFLHT